MCVWGGGGKGGRVTTLLENETLVRDRVTTLLEKEKLARKVSNCHCYLKCRTRPRVRLDPGHPESLVVTEVADPVRAGSLRKRSQKSRRKVARNLQKKVFFLPVPPGCPR